MNPEPASLAEFEARFAEAQKIDGHGFEVHSVVPCPFCAAPGFVTWYPAGELSGRPSLDDQMGEDRTCGECGRSGRTMVTRTSTEVSAEFVQTGGPAPPPWMTPPPRLVP